ncbi:MAG: hypothetical protein II996_03525 [Oscillospiraceae bacterium]|nr:hypothetical protein [Oscillospiraceae bacterium]MBQ4544622.1 hypothetical protein [Oscillospiraceae bacterium]MBQ6902341.1 hypothetical protein [Oscillospiraceae bacterium]
MRIRTTPTEGLLLELGSIAMAVSGTISVIQGENGALPVCVAGWISSLVNLPQIFRFKHRDEEAAYTAALGVLKDESKDEAEKRKALDAIVACANKGYTPAIELIQKLTAASEEEEGLKEEVVL